jgi:hypothetical protein
MDSEHLFPLLKTYDDHTSIDDVSIYVNGRAFKKVQPQYSYMPVDDIFYSDARICYFALPLEKKEQSKRSNN